MTAFDTALNALGSQVGYWKFNDASGNAADSSGNGLTATKFGTVTYGQPSIIPNDTDPCALLDGSTGRFAVTNNALFQFADSMTLLGWFKPTLGKKTHLFERGNYAVGLPGSGIVRGTSAGFSSDTASWMVVSNNPLFIVFSHDKASGLQQVIVNGVTKASHQFTANTGVAATGTNNLELGAFAGAETFQGYFQKFAALSIGITLSQAQTLYLAGAVTAAETAGRVVNAMPFSRVLVTLAANEEARITNTSDTPVDITAGTPAYVGSERLQPRGRVTLKGSHFAGSYSVIHPGNLGAKPISVNKYTVS
jgi:hypothetical protein